MISNRYLTSFLALFLLGCGETAELKGVRAALTQVELTVSSVNSGTVKAEHEAELAFGTVGRVSQLNAHVGMLAKKDQVLAELENVDLKSALETTKRELERYNSLLRARVMAQQETEAARRAYDLAIASYEKSLIRAPFDGLITEVNLEAGQLSQITAIVVVPLIKIVDQQPRYVEAEIDEVDLSTVRVGQLARVKILAERRKPFAAKVRRVVSYVSTLREQDRTSLIELDVDSEGALLPAGASADVEIVAAAKENVLAVPARTVLGRGASRYVYTFQHGHAVQTPVTIGIGNYDRIEILSGLKVGDSVLFPAEGVELEDGLKLKMNEQPWP